ncbi:hypothetical protein ACOSQ3_010603 [Xanthoceras sorbifolium]
MYKSCERSIVWMKESGIKVKWNVLKKGNISTDVKFPNYRIITLVSFLSPRIVKKNTFNGSRYKIILTWFKICTKQTQVKIFKGSENKVDWEITQNMEIYCSTLKRVTCS